MAAAPDAPAVTGEVEPDEPRGPVRRRLAVPLLLVVLLGGLAWWVGVQELDSIERRALVADELRTRTLEHVRLSLAATLAVVALAVPAGIAATRRRFRRLAPALVGLGNAGQAIPSLGILGLLYHLFRSIEPLPSTGVVPVVVALTGYSFLPILRNTVVGLEQVDPSVLDAARAAGMSDGTVLRRIELPLAVPVLLAGARTALVINTGTASLAFLLGGGGLGVLIHGGFQVQRTTILLTGAVLVAALAVAADHLAGVLERRLTPRGL